MVAYQTNSLPHDRVGGAATTFSEPAVVTATAATSNSNNSSTKRGDSEETAPYIRSTSLSVGTFDVVVVAANGDDASLSEDVVLLDNLNSSKSLHLHRPSCDEEHQKTTYQRSFTTVDQQRQERSLLPPSSTSGREPQGSRTYQRALTVPVTAEEESEAHRLEELVVTPEEIARVGEPDEATLQYALQQLSESEKELAARSSYRYEQLSLKRATGTTNDDDVPSAAMVSGGKELRQLRDAAAVAALRRHWMYEGGDTDRAVQKCKATIQHLQKHAVYDIRRCFQGPPSFSSFTQEAAEECRRKIRKHLAGGQFFVGGYTAENRVLIQNIPRNSPVHFKRGDWEGLFESYYWVVEKAIACTEKRTGGLITDVDVSVDFEGFKQWHAAPISITKEILAILAHHYPDRVHRIYWVNAPIIFRCLWAIVKPFMDPVSRSKCVFVTGDEQCGKIFGTLLPDPSQAMPYQRPDGTMVPPSDMEDFFLLPVDHAHGEVEQNNMVVPVRPSTAK